MECSAAGAYLRMRTNKPCAHPDPIAVSGERRLFACLPLTERQRQQCKLINLQTASICLRGRSQTRAAPAPEQTNYICINPVGRVHSPPGIRENTRTIPEYRPWCSYLPTTGVASRGACPCANNCARTKEARATHGRRDRVKTTRTDPRSLVFYCTTRQPRSKSKITAQSPRRSDKTWQRIVACDWSERAWKKTIVILIVSVQSRLDAAVRCVSSWYEDGFRASSRCMSLDDEVQVCCEKSHGSR